MPDCGTISPGLNSCATLSSKANLSTIGEAEFNHVAPAIRTLLETTYIVGLRKAGVPEE
jgi:hypothetical protein